MLNKRCIELLEYLKNNDCMISLKEVALKFSISERSIRYDIENINYYLTKFQLKEIEKCSKGIYVLNEEKEKIQEVLKKLSTNFYVFTSEERKEYLKEKFLFNEENKLINMSEELDVAIGTIKIDLREVKLFFVENELNLNFYSKFGVILEGNEEKIRMLQLRMMNKYLKINSNNEIVFKIDGFKKYIFQLIYDDLKKIYKYLNLKNVYKFIKRIEKKLEIIISDEAFKFLIFYIIIMINRIKNKKKISERSKNKKFIKETREFIIIKDELEFFEEYFNLEITEGEILLLTELFLGAHSYNFNSSFFENWINLEIFTNKLIKEIGMKLEVDLSQDKVLVDGLLTHLKPAYYRIKNNLKLENEVSKEVRESYPELYEKVKQVSKKYIEKYLNKDIPEEEIAYLTIHFKIALDRKINSQRKTKNIIIICGLGYGTSELLAQKLLEKYDVNIVTTLPYHKFLEINNYEDVDFIITTLEIENKLQYRLPIIKVQPILTVEDKKELKKYGISENQKKISLNEILNAIREEANIKNEENLIKKIKKILKYRYIDDIKNDKIYTLSELLPLKNIKVLKKVKDWKEAINISSIPLQIDDCFGDEYVEEIIKNVEQNGSYMVVNEVIALPHARTKNLVKKTGMSLIVLREKVTFPGNKKVKIILTFSSFDQKEHIDALTKFVTILEEDLTEEKVDKLDEQAIKKIIDDENKV